MDVRLFDRLTASFAASTHRRRFLVLLTALPVGGWLRAFVEPETTTAQPVQRVQKHAGKRRQHARHRREHRRTVKRRDNGKGNGNDTAARGGGRCLPLGQLCNVGRDRTPCCANTWCSELNVAGLYTCQHGCWNTSQCQSIFGPDVECETWSSDCSALTDYNCCRPKVCERFSDCTGGGPCCFASGNFRCCARGQTCDPASGCASG